MVGLPEVDLQPRSGVVSGVRLTSSSRGRGCSYTRLRGRDNDVYDRAERVDRGGRHSRSSGTAGNCHVQ
jgi:hypothetical protein